MNSEQFRFESIKEDRGWYFVEYSPPLPSYRFATLQVVIPDDTTKERTIEAMETELQRWINRYPIPLMVSAFDGTGSLIELTDVRDCSHLIGFLDRDGVTLRTYWRLLSNEELPDRALDQAYLAETYSDLHRKPTINLRVEVEKERRAVRIGWSLVFVWAVIVPLAVACLEWSSKWLSALVLVFSFWKALEKTLRLTGKWPLSQRQIKKNAEDQRMRLHHYHCEQNPDGFRRLMVENFENEERKRIQEEARHLKQRPPDPPTAMDE